jgi:hypothetical protein
MVDKSADCPTCERGFLKLIQDKNDVRIFRCDLCGDFLVKEYKLLSVEVLKNSKYYLNYDKELILLPREPKSNILKESKEYLLAARKGLFSLRDLWMSD